MTVGADRCSTPVFRSMQHSHVAAVGIDLGKSTFHLVALDQAGQIVLRRKLVDLTATLKSTLIGMEACGGAHFLARLLREQGHDARIIPAQFVKPFVKSQKNDFLDAEAIAEAVQRPTMRFVPIKTEEQLDMQTLHRVRDRLVGCRTALINQVRAVLLERGLTFPKGRASMAHVVAELVASDTDDITTATREMLALLWQEWQDLQAPPCVRGVAARIGLANPGAQDTGIGSIWTTLQGPRGGAPAAAGEFGA